MLIVIFIFITIDVKAMWAGVLLPLNLLAVRHFFAASQAHIHAKTPTFGNGSRATAVFNPAALSFTTPMSIINVGKHLKWTAKDC